MFGFGAKAIKPEEIRHGSAPMALITLPRTKVNYAGIVGDMLASSVVMAPVQWIQRAIPEARFRVVRPAADGGSDEVQGHKLTALMARPNGAYSGDALISATVSDYLRTGNAYWLVARNGAGQPVELWFAPHKTMTPKWPRDGSEFITHYEYKPGNGTVQKYELEDVVHFRCGIDPNNPRLGASPLASVLREIFVDMEASNFSAAILKNLGVPGLMISPKTEVQMTPQEIDAVKKWIATEFGGDNRGKPLVMGAPTEVSEYGFSPDKMALGTVRNVAEERVCAALGIPAAVVGFGSGLEQTKVGATMDVMRKLAWTNGVLPILSMLADTSGAALLPGFGGDGLVAEYDVDGVAALQDDEKSLVERWSSAVRGGWATVEEARQANGLEAVPSDAIYLRPFSTFEVAAGQPGLTPDSTDPKQASGIKAKATTRRAGLAYVRALNAMLPGQIAGMDGRLTKVFDDLGAAAAAQAGQLKDAADDRATIERILAGLGMEAREEAFREVYESHYFDVAGDVAKAGEAVGLAVNLPDPVARTVVAAGGRRAGLVDLTAQTRDALFDTLTEARAEGLAGDGLARRIRGNISAGPWRTVAIRAKVIARTETKYAQNVSTLARARDAGVERFMVHDGRLGEGRSDPEHIARDGSIVTAERAQQMADEEYPNGTLSFSPYLEVDDDA